MRTYKIAFLYSKNGASWTRTTKHVKADSDTAAIMQINSMGGNREFRNIYKPE